MARPKQGKNSKGKDMHYGVGAIIEENGDYLLIERATKPKGFASIAGHVDEDETAEQALIREVKEESGLKVESYKLILEEELENNLCNKGVDNHHWYLFKCKVSGVLKKSREVKSLGFYSRKDLKKLDLESTWRRLFGKLGVV